jgi:rod shape-determining protein MreC
VVTRPRPRATRLLVVALVAISLAVITLDYRQGQNGPLASVGRTAITVVAPMQRAVTDVTRPVGNFFAGLAHLPSLEQQNQDLRNELRDAAAAAQTDAYFRDQYKTLQDLLGLRQTLDPSGVAAQVIGNGLSNFEWTVTIDKGSDDGVKVNAPVVTGSASSKLLVGTVASVAPNASIVQLIIDRNSGVAAVLSGSDQSGLVVGQGDADLKMSLVGTGTPIAGNESVFTQGYAVNGQPGLYPAGLLIGEVSQTIPVQNAIQASVSVRPAVDFANLQDVLVLSPRGSGK